MTTEVLQTLHFGVTGLHFIEASVSEPHTSELNGRFSLYNIYVSQAVSYIFDAVIKVSLKDDAYENSWSMHTCCTMGVRYVGSDIRDRHLQLEYLLYVDYNCCVDRLNTEGGRGSVSWLIRVRTHKDYARQANLCLNLAYS